MQMQTPTSATSEPPKATTAAPQPSCPKYLTAASMNNRTRTNITDAGPRDPAAGPDFGQLSGIAESRRLMAAGPSPNRHPPAFPRNMPGVTVPRRAPAVAYQLSSIDHNRPPCRRQAGPPEAAAQNAGPPRRRRGRPIHADSFGAINEGPQSAMRSLSAMSKDPAS